MRILFVEDNATNRRVVKEMLAAAGLEMDEAEDGQLGLQKMIENDYDLVLMDLRMPNMDGITAIRELRKRADHKANFPVIVVTADAGSTVKSDCLEAGADDVIMKPVSMQELFDTIGALLARREGGEAMLT